MNLPENIYEDILKNIDEGIFFVNDKKKITYWNKAAEKITGFEKEEVYGENCFNILTHVNNEGMKLCEINCPINRTFNGKSSLSENLYIHHKDGHQIPVKVKTKPIKDNSKTIGAIQIFSDISQNLEMLQTIKY